MSRDGTLPAGVEHNSPDAPWNQPDAQEWPCCMCGEDVGERYSPWTNKYEATKTCPSCDEPICRACADKDEEISERCASCVAREERK